MPASGAPARLLDEQIRADAPTRERLVARFVMIAAPGSGLLMPRVFVEPGTGGVYWGIVWVLGLYWAYYVAEWFVLRRTYHATLSWLGALLDCTMPMGLMLVVLHHSGPVEALIGPQGYVWAMLLLLSALRMNPALSVAVGALAAVEFLLSYLLLMRSHMAGLHFIGLAPAYLYARAVMLLVAGCLAALIATHLVRKTEAALAQARARELFGKYVLHERIGAGGMAEVYRATYCPEGGFERTVAVKRVLPSYAEDEEFIAMFRREAELGSLLNHRGIVQVLDVGRFGESYFMAMEYVDGVSLSTLLRRRRAALPFAAVAFLGAELADALDYVHERRGPKGERLGLVHRDINPPNILLSRMGDVKLADFGIARAALDMQMTRTGQVRGKVSYMSPEQLRGDPLDGRTDLFAVGLTLYEALTGRHPLDAWKASERARVLLDTDLPPPSSVRPDIPALLDDAVVGLLHRDPAQRTPSGHALREALCALRAEAAPYPEGQRALAAAVAQVREQVSGSASGQVAAAATPPGGTTAADEARPRSRTVAMSEPAVDDVQTRRETRPGPKIAG